VTASGSRPLPSYPAPIRASLPLGQFKSIGEMVKRRAAEYGDDPAFTVCLPNGITGALSFAEVDRMSDDLAAYFRTVLSLGRGERVAVMLPNCLAYPLVAFGAFKAGLTLTGINPLYTVDEIAFQLRDSGASVVVTLDLFGARVAKAIEVVPVSTVVRASIAEFFPLLRGSIVRASLRVTRRMRGCPTHWPTLSGAVRAGRKARASQPALVERSIADVQPDDVALLQYTGGTTGVPKAAMLTHYNLLSNTTQLVEIAGHYWDRRRDQMLTVLPLYHIFAFQINCLTCFWLGCGTVLVPSPKPLSNLKPAFRKYRITYATAVNTLLKLLLKEPWFRDHPPRSLRLVYAGGAAVEASVVREWAEVVGGHVTQGYGLSEASPCVTFDPIVEMKELASDGRPRVRPADPEADGLGLPMPMTEIRIVREDGGVAAVGEAGEIEVRGPQVMHRYWNNPDETAEVFDDGWLRTGDIGSINGAGRVTILDRKKDLIIVSGFNVFPTQIEECIAAIPGVSEGAVVGVPDDAAGEAVVAFVVCPSGDSTEREIREHCRQHVAAYKVPRRVVFRTELPKTAIGKVDRKALREEARRGSVVP